MTADEIRANGCGVPGQAFIGENDTMNSALTIGCLLEIAAQLAEQTALQRQALALLEVVMNGPEKPSHLYLPKQA